MKCNPRLALPGTGNALLNTGGLQRVAVNRALHEIACAEDSEAFELAALRLFGNFSRDIQPRSRRTMLDQIEGLMDRVVRADQKIGAAAGQLFRGVKHQFGHARPIPSVDVPHIFRQGVGVQRDFRMIVLAKELRALERNGAVTESGSFGAAGDDADV